MNFKKLLKIFEAPQEGDVSKTISKTYKAPDYDVNKPSVYRGDTGVGNPPTGTVFPHRYLPPDEKYKDQRADHYYVDKNKVGYDKYGNPEVPVVPSKKRTAPKPIPNPNQDIVDQGNRIRNQQQAVLRGEQPTDRFKGQADTDARTGEDHLRPPKPDGQGAPTVEPDYTVEPSSAAAEVPRATAAEPDYTVEPSPAAAKVPSSGTVVRSSSGAPVTTGSGGVLKTRSDDEIARDMKNPYASYSKPSGSYKSIGDWWDAVKGKKAQAVAPTPSEPKPATTSAVPKPEVDVDTQTAPVPQPEIEEKPLNQTSAAKIGGGYGKFSEEKNMKKELEEMMRLSGLQLNEKSVSKQQQKFMGMVHAMQKGEKIKGASPELKKAAKGMTKKAAKDFASTKHKGLPKRVDEGMELVDETRETLKHIANRFKYETKMFMQSGHMDQDLFHALYDYYLDKGEMPYGVAKGDPQPWVEEHFYQDMGSGMSESTNDLTELARLAGLSEGKLDECGMDMPDQEDSMSVSTNMDSKGHKNVNISAEGEKADELLGMLKLAGMKHDRAEEEPVAVISSDDDEMLDEGGLRLFHRVHNDDGTLMGKVYKDPEWNEFVVKFFKMGKPLPSSTWYHTDDIEDAISTAQKELEFMQQRGGEEQVEEEYANEPDEEYETISAITRQGNDLNREKRQHKHSYRNSDNPMSMHESILELDAHLEEMLESIKIKEMDSVLDAEKPYRDPKTGKMITPPKGATMPPADSEFAPGDPRNLGAIKKPVPPKVPPAPPAPTMPKSPVIPKGMNIEPDDAILNLPPKQRGLK